MNIEKLINDTSEIYLRAEGLVISIRATLDNNELETFVKEVTVNLLGEALVNLKLQIDLLIDLCNSKSDSDISKALDQFNMRIKELDYKDIMKEGKLCKWN